MRTRLVWLGGLAVVGCTMTNPAFEGGTGTEGTMGDGDGDPVTSAEGSSSSGEEAPDPVCELGPGDPLEIDLGPGGCTGDMPENYDRFHVLAAATGSTLSVYSCAEGSIDCSACDAGRNDIPTPMKFAPLQLDGIAPTGTCLFVSARRVNPTIADGCNFQTVSVQVAEGQTRLPLLVGRNALGPAMPPADSNGGLVGFDPQLSVEDICPCDQYVDACCMTVAPTSYGWNVGTQTVPFGQDANLMFGNASKYLFSALDGFQSGDCDAPLRAAWGMVYAP